MLINADKPFLWKPDIAASVDLFNTWFLQFAPRTYQQERVKATESASSAIIKANDLLTLTSETLTHHPEILPLLRMTTAPPLARDRLIGLAGVPDSLIDALEAGQLPPRIDSTELGAYLGRITAILIILFLCGYFGSPYLGYEAAEGLDWVWEHRIDDLQRLELD